MDYILHLWQIGATRIRCCLALSSRELYYIPLFYFIFSDLISVGLPTTGLDRTQRRQGKILCFVHSISAICLVEVHLMTGDVIVTPREAKRTPYQFNGGASEFLLERELLFLHIHIYYYYNSPFVPAPFGIIARDCFLFGAQPRSTKTNLHNFQIALFPSKQMKTW